MNLVPLFEEALEFQDYNGTVLSNGKAAVYYIGRTRLADIYNDVAAEYPAENPKILDNLGMGPVYVNPAFDYELVVFDEYNNELFSVKKYLHSKGEHSTANVVVTPSENIAVSAWTVGDVQVYMPYLTGQLGKVYQGIEPIVVNNTEDKISANHVPLGVQDPLYFVQDDEEGCIIGFSGQTIPEGVMSESGLGFENDKITGYNGSAFSAGNEYEAGNYISIDNNTINVVNLPTSADVQNIVDVATSGLMPSGDYLTKESADTLYAPTGNYLTGLPDDLVYTADITGLATTAELDNKLDKADSANFLLTSDSAKFYPMDSNPSGYLTAHQSLQGYATEQWVEDKGYLTAVDIPESATWNATTQTVSANSAQWAGGTANPQIPVTSTSGISIFESGDKVYFNISADYAFSDDLTGKQDSLTFSYKDTAISSIDNSALYDNSAHARITTLAGRISDLSSNKLDATAFSDVSGTFLTAHQDLSDYQTTAGMTAYQPVGDYYSASNPSGFITGVDLSDYATTAELADKQDITGMTAYQPVGNYQTAGDYLTTADSANFYTTANESGFITGVPETYLQNTDLTITDGKITEISGVPLSAGDELPSGVMNTSALEYNAVNEISGYNGSAIAQYGAEKQFIVHDDTLVHLSNSAQYALGVQVPNVAKLMGVDETVLWSGSANTGTLNLSEPLTSFKEFKFYVYIPERGTNQVLTYYDAVNTVNPGFLQLTMSTMTTGSVISAWWQGIYNINGTVDTATYKSFSIYANGQYYKQCSSTACGTNDSRMVIKKIIGIGKKV